MLRVALIDRAPSAFQRRLAQILRLAGLDVLELSLAAGYRSRFEALLRLVRFRPDITHLCRANLVDEVRLIGRPIVVSVRAAELIPIGTPLHFETAPSEIPSEPWCVAPIPLLQVHLSYTQDDSGDTYGWLGELEWTAGFEYVLSAFCAIRARHLNATFMVCTAGSEWARFRFALQDLGLDGVSVYDLDQRVSPRNPPSVVLGGELLGAASSSTLALAASGARVVLTATPENRALLPHAAVAKPRDPVSLAEALHHVSPLPPEDQTNLAAWLCPARAATELKQLYEEVLR